MIAGPATHCRTGRGASSSAAASDAAARDRPATMHATTAVALAPRKLL
jgi:hypothetical protein